MGDAVGICDDPEGLKVVSNEFVVEGDQPAGELPEVAALFDFQQEVISARLENHWDDVVIDAQPARAGVIPHALTVHPDLRAIISAQGERAGEGLG
ncbi:MAG: hypothetical protein KJ060_22470, partial [Candidatus Hydrogenedentes bacterium]|nr:hypothetical protein [Candidatus Hydrogenedentota bacterium]